MNPAIRKSFSVLAAATMFGLVAGIGATEAAKSATGTVAAAPVAQSAASVDPRFAVLDTDGDGSLLQGELPAGHDLGTDLFAAFDTNQDLRISSAEFAVYAGGSNDAVEGDEEESE